MCIYLVVENCGEWAYNFQESSEAKLDCNQTRQVHSEKNTKCVPILIHPKPAWYGIWLNFTPNMISISMSCYEDVEAALGLHKTQYSFIVGGFNAKVRNKGVGMTAIGNFGIDTENNKGDMLVELAEKNNLKIMNTLIDHKACEK